MSTVVTKLEPFDVEAAFKKPRRPKSKRGKLIKDVLKPRELLPTLYQLGVSVQDFETVQIGKLPVPLYEATLKVEGLTFQEKAFSKVNAKNNVAKKAMREIIVKRMEELQHDKDVTIQKENRVINNDQFRWPVAISFALRYLTDHIEVEHNLSDDLMHVDSSNHCINKVEVELMDIDTEDDGEPKLKKMKIMDGNMKLPKRIAMMDPISGVCAVFKNVDFNITGESSNFVCTVTIDGVEFSAGAVSKKESKKWCCMKILDHHKIPYAMSISFE